MLKSPPPSWPHQIDLPMLREKRLGGAVRAACSGCSDPSSARCPEPRSSYFIRSSGIRFSVFLRLFRGHRLPPPSRDLSFQRPLGIRRSREAILRLLLAEYCRTLQSMAEIDQRRATALWRHTVEAWLRHQGLISVGPNKQPDQNVSPMFPQKGPIIRFALQAAESVFFGQRRISAVFSIGEGVPS